MTLRHRLLLVYSIVVLLSAATVGAAIFELQHAHRIIRDLQHWNQLVLEMEKMKRRWPPPPDVELDSLDFQEELARQFMFLAGASSPEDEYTVADELRELLVEVYRKFDEWSALSSEERASKTELVGEPLWKLALVLDTERVKLGFQADNQNIRTRILLVIVGFMMLLHLLVIGTLLRRWLLWPMERLNRQVEALAMDRAPSEPLLDSPLEMARLATALDRARQSLGALRQQLLDAERLTVIGQMAAQLAHNLRNPLASIRAAAQLTLRQTGDAEPLRQRMVDIMGSVDRLNRWVMGLMEVARRDPTLTKQLDVVPVVVQATEAVVGELTAKEITLSVNSPAEGVVCGHDPATLEHALVAMLVNAIEASPLGSEIVVSVERITYSDEAAACRISVSDHGTGLPVDCPERIFDFSYSTKQRGMGLGLALARQALTRQGGSTHAFNNPDGGATVCVELPIGLHSVADASLQPPSADLVSSAATRA